MAKIKTNIHFIIYSGVDRPNFAFHDIESLFRFGLKHWEDGAEDALNQALNDHPDDPQAVRDALLSQNMLDMGKYYDCFFYEVSPYQELRIRNNKAGEWRRMLKDGDRKVVALNANKPEGYPKEPMGHLKKINKVRAILFGDSTMHSQIAGTIRKLIKDKGGNPEYDEDNRLFSMRHFDHKRKPHQVQHLGTFLLDTLIHPNVRGNWEYNPDNSDDTNRMRPKPESKDRDQIIAWLHHNAKVMIQGFLHQASTIKSSFKYSCDALTSVLRSHIDDRGGDVLVVCSSWAYWGIYYNLKQVAGGEANTNVNTQYLPDFTWHTMIDAGKKSPDEGAGEPYYTFGKTCGVIHTVRKPNEAWLKNAENDESAENGGGGGDQ